MARDVFDLLMRTGHVTVDDDTIASLRSFVTRRLRLELFLEVLTNEIPPSVVFKPFEQLVSASPNFNHLAIAALTSRPIATTNQDLLLEDALCRMGVRRRIIHLHGRCDNLASIITIVSQYLGGLDRDVRRSFQCEIAGQNVLVLGYSGRDLDVMQSLMEAEPRSVTWLLHEQSTPDPEIEHAQNVLGSRLQFVSCNTREWLRDHLSESATSRIKTMGVADRGAPPAMPQSVYEAFCAIPPLKRNRAVARLLEHLGQYHKAKEIYEKLRPVANADKARRLFDLGRVETRIVDHEAGRKKLVKIEHRRNIPVDIQGRLLLNIADTLRNTSRPTEANHQLDKLDRLVMDKKDKLTYKDFWHLRGWPLIGRAQTIRLEGRPSTAASLYKRAERAFQRSRDMDGHIAVLTWQAETELMLGNFDHARSLAEEAGREASAYAKYVLSGLPLYVQAEYLTLRGRVDDALNVLHDATRLLKRYGNIQGTMWSLLQEADCLRGRSLDEATARCRNVRRRLRKHDSAHVRIRLYLMEAEIARERGDMPAVEVALSALSTHLHNKTQFTRPPMMALAHSFLVKAECARQVHDGVAVKMLKTARDEYARIGAKSFVARASVAIALATGADMRSSKLLAQCRSNSYDLEVRHLTAMDSSFYPIHFV